MGKTGPKYLMKAEHLTTADLKGVLDGSNKALCLRRAGPDAIVSSIGCVEMYSGGGPPKISSLFSNTCSQRCRVFRTEWHNGEHTGRSKAYNRGHIYK